VTDIAALACAYTEAWNSGQPAAVASHYAEDGYIIINAGQRWQGRAGVTEMAAGFMADIPGMVLSCEGVRAAGRTAIYLWRFTGTHGGSGKPVDVAGWEAWTLNDKGQIAASLGWFDAEDYARQTG
jgi:uncharacterized protein (TIGR02246 family)